jgi:hypothetical protein
VADRSIKVNLLGMSFTENAMTYFKTKIISEGCNQVPHKVVLELIAQTTDRFCPRDIFLGTKSAFWKQMFQLSIVCFLLLLFAGASAQAEDRRQSVYESTVGQIAHFTIVGEYLGYDGFYSTYRYHIENNGGKALSFIQIGFCDQIKSDDVEIVEKTGFRNGPEAIELLYHGKTGIYGLKAEAIDDRKPQVFDLTFNIRGYWPPAINAAAIHAGGGQNYPKGEILGPGCPQAECGVCCYINNGKEWRFKRPGTYASLAMDITLSGYGAVTLHFEDFNDLINVDDPDLPPLEVSYGIGNTIEEAEANGWLRAGTTTGFNGYTHHLILAGTEEVIRVWSRVIVKDSDKVGRYSGSGRVLLEIECPI